MSQALLDISVFLLAGLGEAPFVLKGIFELPGRSLLEANPDAYNNAMRDKPVGYACGTCALCGTGIMVNYLVDSACGKKHAIGSECIGKIGNTKLTSEAHEMKLARDRQKRLEKRQEQHRLIIQAERDANGGETIRERNDRIWFESQESERLVQEKKVQPVLEGLASFLEALKSSNSNFAHRVACAITSGAMPNSQAFYISCEIAAKQVTGKRTNSKEYKAVNLEFKELLIAAIEVVDPQARKEINYPLS